MDCKILKIGEEVEVEMGFTHCIWEKFQAHHMHEILENSKFQSRKYYFVQNKTPLGTNLN